MSHLISTSTKILHAGMTEMLYDNGTLRHIRLGDEELLRMVYVAVRDTGWGTFTPHLSNQEIVPGHDHFTIRYDCHYKINGDRVFKWQVTITGTAYNEISFSVQGKALASFKKNRAGLCILHPVRSCLGQHCEITTATGEIIRDHFPVFIAPHQPFKNIRKMKWTTPGDVTCELSLQGDIFETEDQRNWTDASFKTYSTPLDLPYPVLLKAGDRVEQSMTFRACTKKTYRSRKPKKAENLLQFDLSAPVHRPDLGISIPTAAVRTGEREAALFQKLDLDHYRIDLKLYEKAWYPYLLQKIDMVRSFQSGLEIALHTGEDGTALKEFIRVIPKCGSMILKIILSGPSKITSNSIINKYVPLLRKALPHVQLGAGTDSYFAELNRNRIDAGLLDFVSFSLNPQVHASDDLTLIENLEGQSDVVVSAKQLYPRKPVHISPVTLMPRFNPDTAAEFISGGMPADKASDPRQKTVFAAGWTLGSFRYLSAAGASSVTYYETSGDKGIMPASDPARASVYPVYLLLRLITEFKKGKLFAGISPDPLKYSGVFFVKGKSKRWIIANHVPETLNISVNNPEHGINLRVLDQGNAGYFTSHPDSLFDTRGKQLDSDTVQLPPYGIGILDTPF